jgi:hypothetical protein
LLYGNGIPKEVLESLSGFKIQLDVQLSDGSLFGIDCERVDTNELPSETGALGCETKENPSLSEQFKDTLQGSQTFDVKYSNDISVNFSSSIFVGKENAHKIATIYTVNEAGELVRLQSAVIDSQGNATFYLQSVNADANIVVGVGVDGETIENAIIPDKNAVDNHDLLDRYRPIEYAVTDDREFLGLNSWQFALAVFGVIVAIVIVVATVTVIIYRKKRLELLHKLNGKTGRRGRI